MNLRARILGLISLSALTLFSCEEDTSTIGLPPENNLGIFFADIPLGDKATQVWVEGVNTRGSGIILSGGFQDPNFGVIETKSYSELGINSTNYESSATFDSVVLELRISALEGNMVEDVEHSFEVYQLADSISLTENGQAREFTSSTTEALGDLIGQFTTEFYTDSLGLTIEEAGLELDTTSTGADSAFVENNFDSNEIYIYQNKVKLDQNFGNRIFSELRTNQYDSAAETAALFKGLHIKATNVNGAIVSHILDTYSRMIFYYTEEGEQKISVFPFSSTRSYNNITPNSASGWTGSDFDDLTEFYEPYTPSTNSLYLQSGTNLVIKVDMSGLQSAMRDTVPNAIIQSAEVVIPGTSNEINAPTSVRLGLTSIDSLANGNYNVSFPPNLANQKVASAYNDDIDGYKMEVPLYLERFFNDEDFEYDQLIIAPVNSNLVLPTSSVRQFVINKNDLRIRYFYTIPDKD